MSLTKFLIFSSIILIFVILCISSLFVKNDFLSCFSLVHNFKGAYNNEVSTRKSQERAYLHGAKALVVIASICTHSYLFMGVYISHPFANLKELSLEPYRMLLARATSVTGQLFFIG